MSELHIDSVTKNYGLRPILTDIYLGCRTGEIVGLLGRNGCGKSTLLKIVFASLKADYKYVRLDGKQIRSLGENGGRIRYLPQHHFLPDHLKVKTLIGLLCGPQRRAEVAAHPLIVPVLDKQSRNLSGGELRVVEILLTIYSDALFVLLDEPFNGVSPVLADPIKKAIRSESARKGFVITDHGYRHVLDVATRLVLMRDGGMRNIDSAEELQRWNYLPETNSEF